MLDNKPTGWFNITMKTVGTFDAKTHFTGLCQQVAETGSPIIVSRRGRPLVMISPVPSHIDQKREDILSSWQSWEREHGRDERGEFPDVWKMRNSRNKNPLQEDP